MCDAPLNPGAAGAVKTAPDRWIFAVDRWLRKVHGVPPGDALPPGDLPDPAPAAGGPSAAGASVLHAAARRRSAGLMRVNHAGEVCAQALYLGQLAGARSPRLHDHLRQAAQEEARHLSWCRQRLLELDAAPSRLTPLWYAGSFLLGAGAALAGDRWSLGFLAETENQVVAHLDRHLRLLPSADTASRVVLQRMLVDETRHRDQARHAGGTSLPGAVRMLMRTASSLMTFTSRHL